MKEQPSSSPGENLHQDGKQYLEKLNKINEKLAKLKSSSSNSDRSKIILKVLSEKSIGNSDKSPMGRHEENKKFKEKSMDIAEDSKDISLYKAIFFEQKGQDGWTQDLIDQAIELIKQNDLLDYFCKTIDQKSGKSNINIIEEYINKNSQKLRPEDKTAKYSDIIARWYKEWKEKGK